MTAREFALWLRSSRKRETFTYYSGNLAADSGGDQPVTPKQRKIWALAEEARKAYRAGFVNLVQRRVSDGDTSYFDYIAIKRV